MPRGYNIDKLNRKELIAIAKYNTKLINESFKALQGWDEDETINYINEKKQMFGVITGTKNKRKVASGNLSKFNKRKLKLIIVRQKQYLQSSWSSPEGREEIFEKQYQSLKNTYSDLSRENLKQFQKFMTKNEGIASELMEQNYLPSNNILDLTRYYETDEIINAISDMNGKINNRELATIGKPYFKSFLAQYIVAKRKGVDLDTFYRDYLDKRNNDYEDL